MCFSSDTAVSKTLGPFQPCCVVTVWLIPRPCPSLRVVLPVPTEPRLPVRSKRIPTAKTSLPGRLFLSAAADAPATGASLSVQEDEKRAAVKSALLGIFGEVRRNTMQRTLGQVVTSET